MRYLVVLVFCLCAIVSTSTATAKAIADSIAYQGSLTDASNNPVPDGPRDLTLSIWNDPDVGDMLHSEVVVVNVSNGLFSTCIGCGIDSFFDIFTEQSLYLQVQLAGQTPMTPRTVLRNVPFSFSSASLHSEASNGTARARGMVVSKPGSVKPHARYFLDADDDGDGSPEYIITDSISTDYASRLLGHDLDDDGQPDVVIAESTSPAGVSHKLMWDSNADLISDTEVDQDCDGTDASITLRSLNGLPPGVPAEDNIQLVTSGLSSTIGINETLPYARLHVSRDAADPHASSILAADIDLDGLADRSIDDDCDGISASRSMSFFDVFTEATIDDDCDATGAQRRLSSGGIGSSGEDGVAVTLRCSPDSATETTELRKNGSVVCADFGRHTPFHNSYKSSFFDASNEMTIDQDCDATGSRLAINSKGTSAKRTVACSTDLSNSSVVVAGDIDNDGLDDNEASLRITPTTSSLAIKTKGTGAQRFMAGGDCDDTDATLFVDCDSDGDGIPESEISQSVTPTTSSVAINTKGTGADKNRIISIGTTELSSSLSLDNIGSSGQDGVRLHSSDDSSRIACVSLNGLPPGTPVIGNLEFVTRPANAKIGIGTILPTARMVLSSDADSVVQSADMSDGSSSSSYNMRTRIHELETVLKNIGLLGTSRATQACNDIGASSVCDFVDGSGGGGGGGGSVVASLTASSTRSEIKGYFEKGDVPTQGQFSTLLDSDGARSLLSGGTGGSTTATIRMNATPDSTVFDLGYHGSTTGTIRLMANSTGSANPIEHSSGAHLTSGGVWTNASDASLKENFQTVDGEELLEKISELPISQWNYKNESEKATHIGPTAQDFKAIFGVGENDKTISTIDPSGIALAAIKELYKKSARVEELEKQILELQEAVKQLQNANL